MTETRRTNTTKQTLLNGGTVLVAEVNRVASPLMVEAVSLAGFGCV